MLKNSLLYFILFSFVFACTDDLVKELDEVIDETDTLKVDTVKIDTIEVDSILPFSNTFAGYWYNTKTSCGVDILSESGRKDFINRYSDNYLETSIRPDTTTNNRKFIPSFLDFSNLQYMCDMNITLNDSVLVGYLTVQHYVMFEWEINGKMDYVYPENDQGIYVYKTPQYFKLDTLEDEGDVPVFTLYEYRLYQDVRPMVSELSIPLHIEELSDSTMHLSLSGVKWCLNDTTGVREPCYRINYDMYYLKRRGK